MQAENETTLYTVTDAADWIERRGDGSYVQVWKVRRIVDFLKLPVIRLGGYRGIREEDLPLVEKEYLEWQERLAKAAAKKASADGLEAYHKGCKDKEGGSRKFRLDARQGPSRPRST